jgi:L-ascorbate metabolism protein UlaG (beta-lactamase superfamily)
MKFRSILAMRLVLFGLLVGMAWHATANADYPDFNGDRIIDFNDFSKLAQYWRQDESSVDIAPSPLGDGIVNFKDLAVLAEHWLQEQIVHIQWLGHASVKIWTDDAVMYVDPRNLSISPHDATLVLVTHSHSDHYSAPDITRVSGPATRLIAAASVIATHGSGQAIAPGQTVESDGVTVTAVPAYNISKTNHPKSSNWVGFIVELAGKRIYIAGDTDLIPEMQTLGKIDVAFLPISPAYTMGPDEAAQATMYIMPRLAVPYHWGTSTLADAQRFAQKAYCNVKIMTSGEITNSEDWPTEILPIAHWKLDETEGAAAFDSAGSSNGTSNGNPIWLPTGGKIDGALQLDGIDDYVSTPFVVNPADGPLSLFAWIKAGMPGQVIISQIDSANWLAADPSEGKLMTNLSPPAGRFPPQPLASQSVVTGGDWHRVGLVWNGSQRILYVDDVEVAKDTQTGLAGSQGGLHIGAGKNLEAGSFWSGMIDDVRIHDRAVAP